MQAQNPGIERISIPKLFHAPDLLRLPPLLLLVDPLLLLADPLLLLPTPLPRLPRLLCLLRDDVIYDILIYYNKNIHKYHS